MRKIWFSSLSVYSYVFLVPLSQMHICMIYAGGLSLSRRHNECFSKKTLAKILHGSTNAQEKTWKAGVAYSVRSSIDTCTVKPFFTFKGKIHGLMNYIDTKAKCHHLKKLTCTRTMRQADFIDWRYSQSCWYFRPSFVICCPSPRLSSSTFPPPPFPVWISIYSIHVFSVYGGGGYGVLGLRQINICRKFPLQVKFFRWRHLHCLLWVFTFKGQI